MSEKKAAQPEPHTTPDQISALQPDSVPRLALKRY